MGQPYQYFHPRQWANELSDWRPSTSPPAFDTFILRDEAGVVVGSNTIATLVLTLYDEATDTFINGLESENVLNTRGWTLNAAGVMTPTFLKDDNPILQSVHAQEVRHALIEYTWPLSTPTKSGAIEIQYVVRNLHRRSTGAI